MVRRNGPDLGALAAGEETYVALEQPDPAADIGSSEFAQMVREFTDLVRRIRASDLTASDRATLRSLLHTLTDEILA